MCIDLLNHKQKQAFDRELVWSWGNLEEHLQTWSSIATLFRYPIDHAIEWEISHCYISRSYK